MTDHLRRYRHEAYALLRSGAGFLFLCQGRQKLFGSPMAMPQQVPAFIAVFHCFAFLFVSAHGAGKWSVDAARG